MVVTLKPLFQERSICVELLPQIRLGYVSEGLRVDSPESSLVNLIMQRDRERLPSPALQDPAQLDMAAMLRSGVESEHRKDLEQVFT